MISLHKTTGSELSVRHGEVECVAVNPNIGVIGAGSFAFKVMLPLLKKFGNLNGIATTRSINAIFVDEYYNFSFATTIPARLIRRKTINTIFILTRSNLHVQQAIDTLKAGKHTFVEKPLAISLSELEDLRQVYISLPSPKPLLMTGFNRRFAPVTEIARNYLKRDEPITITIRVKAESLTPDHWIRFSKVGGGRIINELCPYIDLVLFLTRSTIRSVHVQSSQESDNEGVFIHLSLKDGSNASVYFTSDPETGIGEIIKIVSGENTILIDNFRKIEISNAGKRIKKVSYRRADLGYAAEVKAFLNAISDGGPSPIPFDDIINSLTATFRVNAAFKESS